MSCLERIRFRINTYRLRRSIRRSGGQVHISSTGFGTNWFHTKFHKRNIMGNLWLQHYCNYKGVIDGSYGHKISSRDRNLWLEYLLKSKSPLATLLKDKEKVLTEEDWLSYMDWPKDDAVSAMQDDSSVLVGSLKGKDVTMKNKKYYWNDKWAYSVDGIIKLSKEKKNEVPKKTGRD